MNRPLLFALLLAPLSLLTACHNDAAAGAGREPDEYVGCATDELWPTFDDVADVVSDAQAPQLVPVLQDPATPAVPQAFRWQPSASQSAPPEGDVPSSCPQWNTGFTTLHLAPISGTAYDLQVKVDGVVSHRVITTLTRWTPSDAVWASFRGKTILLTVRRMVVLNNDRREGPYAPTAPASIKLLP